MKSISDEIESMLSKNYENVIINDKKVEVTKKQTGKIKFKVGDYVQFGKYYNEPILWKCMKNDENGYLLFSEYIICLKAFDAAESGKAANINIFSGSKGYGSNKWSNSNIREWLNSKEQKVKLSTQPPTKKAVWNGHNAYADEKGFLTNFSIEEIDRIGINKQDGLEDKVFLLSRKELEKLFPDQNNRIKLFYYFFTLTKWY